ncbi:MAG: hypothetical protein HUK24_09410 [Sphaerochaetaceae bacterium]|nr:hypothetical protein [Sphaerochaetaceae bacterium]
MKKLNLDEQTLDEINLEDFKIVPSDAFLIPKRPSMTIYHDSFAFSKESHDALFNCDYVQFYVDMHNKKFAIKTSTSGESDSIFWNRNTKNTSSERFKCIGLLNQIYKEWKLDSRNRYRMEGKLVKSDHKVMLLFDFANATGYDGKNKPQL